MTLVLLDTNAYLRLAKRIKPLLGVKFGQKDYVLTILKDVENEVHRNSRLQFHYPWFDDAVLAEDFDISIWHGHELLKKMLTAKIIDNILVREIYESLELNDDLTHTWREAKHISFKKIFGPKQ